MKNLPSTTKKASRKKMFRAIRWTINQAASEFEVDRRTVAKRVKESGTLPGKDSKFSTSDIHAAICGDYERERIRKMTEDADTAALHNAKERKLLVDKTDLLGRMEPIYVSMKEIILGCSMSETEKDATLSKIAELHRV